MSLRPRFAGDGQLRLPAKVEVVVEPVGSRQRGDVVGTIGQATYDPFERVGSGLLLAEEFARVDLSDPRRAVEWHSSHGVVDVDHFLPSSGQEVVGPPGEITFHDHALDVLQQQENVRWHLLALARLSDHVAARDADGGHDWQASWAQPAIQIGLHLVWLGGGDDYERHIRVTMTKSATPHGTIPTGVEPAEYAEWSRRAHAAYRRIVSDDVPVISLRPMSHGSATVWDREALTGTPEEHELRNGLTTGWWGLVELERRLLAPYVGRAGEHQVEIAYRSGDSAAVVPEGGRRLAVYERRRWSSVLAPVYVQLLDGLIRVTEGQRAARLCKECGQPFLSLDARRAAFCTDRERFRYSQRERRWRLRSQAPVTVQDNATAGANTATVEANVPDPWLMPHVANQLRRRTPR